MLRTIAGTNQQCTLRKAPDRPIVKLPEYSGNIRRRLDGIFRPPGLSTENGSLASQPLVVDFTGYGGSTFVAWNPDEVTIYARAMDIRERQLHQIITRARKP